MRLGSHLARRLASVCYCFTGTLESSCPSMKLSKTLKPLRLSDAQEESNKAKVQFVF